MKGKDIIAHTTVRDPNGSFVSVWILDMDFSNADYVMCSGTI